MPRSARAILLILVGLLAAADAHAFVPTSLGSKPGQFDFELRLSWERGKIEPNENSDSWQTANWKMYAIGVGYSLGNVGKLKDVSVRLEGTVYTSPAEINERTDVLASNCQGVVLDAGKCQFYPKDNGGFTTATVAFNLIHKPKYALGAFLQGTVPVSANLDKFANPHVHYVGGGVSIGATLSDWLSFDSNIFVGSGSGADQNAVVRLIQRFSFESSVGTTKVGLKIGTYFDGDLQDRFEEQYDAAYTAGYPDTRDRIRMMRFGVITQPYVAISKRVSLELIYVQKLFGYDTPATQFYTASLRTVL